MGKVSVQVSEKFLVGLYKSDDYFYCTLSMLYNTQSAHSYYYALGLFQRISGASYVKPCLRIARYVIIPVRWLIKRIYRNVIARIYRHRNYSVNFFFRVL